MPITDKSSANPPPATISGCTSDGVFSVAEGTFSEFSAVITDVFSPSGLAVSVLSAFASLPVVEAVAEVAVVCVVVIGVEAVEETAAVVGCSVGVAGVVSAKAEPVRPIANRIEAVKLRISWPFTLFFI
ncbi:hypothetical protein PROPEN_03079 [Proteus penneri ATCC 35198]|nr:hypothetical protein PROPEN_03079 [Proteus penneri ATCC 35198]